jgi:NADH-quinone oxidoreductase subunit C
MSLTPEQLKAAVEAALGSRAASVTVALGVVTVTLASGGDLATCAQHLRDAPALRFEQLTDLCGMDYSAHGEGAWEGPRYAAVLHLLSLAHNARLRVRAFAADDDFPLLPSVSGVWAGANWYEREAFDLYGIVFDGHPDLRRLLTDYGFVGHPFRKDFPVSGYVEMRYDPDQKRVIYQPVTIEPREVVPRVIREANYADTEGLRRD